MRPTWNDNGHGGVIAIQDQGDFTGAIVTTARVVQGGNGLWTPIVSQSAKGRLKRVGHGRVASKHLGIYYPGQVRTKEEAVQLCESEWERLIEMKRPLSPYEWAFLHYGVASRAYQTDCQLRPMKKRDRKRFQLQLANDRAFDRLLKELKADLKRAVPWTPGTNP